MKPPSTRRSETWLSQAAVEIAAKKGNPNQRGTRQCDDRPVTLSSSYTMSEATGKLQQKDYTPQVDQVIPQATALAKVGPLPSASLLVLVDIARSRLGNSKTH
jgi:hypothetical protein